MKSKLIERLFPLEFDFYKMLTDQARKNHDDVQALLHWVTTGSEKDAQALLDHVREADDIRMNLESNLVKAFSTPFDRGDIYSISVAMDKVIEYTQSTLLSMQAYAVPADEIIAGMIKSLDEGTQVFAEAVGWLGAKPDKSGQLISRIRQTHTRIEQLYREGIAARFAGNDPMAALKFREVYHHIKDASSDLESAVDLLHRIVVRLT
jgi:uncharacterized protein